MKKRLLLLLLTVLAILLVPSGSASNPTRPMQSTQESNLFFDDFESYESGSFPSRGGWQLVFGGDAILENHMVTNLEAHSGSKSLVLNNKAFALKTFGTQASTIGYEVAVNLAGEGAVTVGFGYSKDPQANKFWATVSFGSFIQSDDRTKLGEWAPGIWYVVKVILNRMSNTYGVWINDALIGERLKTSAQDTGLIDALELMSGNKVYFDDVRVFAVSASTVAVSSSLSTVTTTATIPTTRTVATVQPTVSVPPLGPDLTPIALSVLVVGIMIGLAVYGVSMRRRTRKPASVAEPPRVGLFEVSVTVPSAGKTVSIEAGPDHTVGSLVDTLMSTLDLPKGKRCVLDYAGKLIGQKDFGKSLAALGIEEGSKLSLRVVE